MKNFLTIPALALAIGLFGCASTGQVDKLESTSETNTKLLRENEFRLHQLETSMASLNSQVAQLNNRVYEVRTRNGKKTSMTVVPIVPAATPPAVGATATAGTATAPSAPAAQASQPTSRAEALLAQARRVAAERNQTAQGATPAPAQGTAPAGGATQQAPAAGAQAAAPAAKGRMIDPAAVPTPIPAPTARAAAPAQRAAATTASAGASGSVGRPVAGPSGTLAAQATPSPAALPPLDLPPTTLPAAAPAGAAQPAAAPRTNAVTGGANTVPVPAIPASGLALPPEHPGLPPVGQAQASEPGAPQKALASPVTAQPSNPAPAVSTASPRGEEAAYKAALNATLAGRTDEGLRLFHDFLQHYPHGRYAANADYWIGEGLYAQGKYPEALAQFQKVNDAYPQHHKNADALLKAGMTMSRLGDKTAAAEKYRTLMTQFPNSDAARRARAMGVAR